MPASMAPRTSRYPGSETSGSAGVGDQRDGFARLQPLHQLRRPLRLVVVVVADGGLLNAVVVQQFARLAGVLAGDQVRRTQTAAPRGR